MYVNVNLILVLAKKREFYATAFHYHSALLYYHQTDYKKPRKAAE